MSLLMGESGCRLAEHARRAVSRSFVRVVAEDLAHRTSKLVGVGWSGFVCAVCS